MEPNIERVIFVHAHPDDETITTGGTIATLIDRGAAVTVVTCTRGELGEVIPIELKHLEGDGERLAAEREIELANALAILGVKDHRFLGDATARRAGLTARHYLDSGMKWGPHGAEPAASLSSESFCAADFGEAAADLATVIDEVKPDAIVSYDETGGYGHPDHIRAHLIARRAAEVMGVPFYAVDAPGSAEAHSSTRVVEVNAVHSRIRDALRAHRTQITVDGDTFALSSGPARPIPAVESFTRLLPRRAGGSDPVAWNDQPRSVQIFGWAIALVVGVIVGGISVVNHQFAPIVFGVPVPVGIGVALLVIIAMLVGTRLAFPGRAVVGFLAVGLLATIALFSTESRGGSVLIPANPAGYLLTYGPLIMTVLVLAWPKVGTFSRDRLGSRPELKGTTTT